MALPKQDRASTYSDFFVHKATASGKRYEHRNFTAALVPRSNWAAVPLGTLVEVTY